MKRIVLAVALAAAAAVVPCAAYAQMMSHDEKVTFAQWRDNVQKQLAKELHYPHPMFGAPAATGIVRIKFNCSEAGRPDKVSIAKSSGSGQLDHAALRAISRISSLHPLPPAFANGQAFQAMVLFDADNADGYEARRNKMIADALKSNARFADPAVASIGIAVASGGN